MLGVFAEFETNLRRGRQMKGIAKAKQLGVYKGGASDRKAREGGARSLAKRAAHKAT
jgi:DNA invertase Pin-like site-specific DNA recombinase